MILLSVNIGATRTQFKAKGLETTGIFKLPVLEPLHVSVLGLQGDAVCDQEHHGGPDQAVYIYGAADYTWWSGELGRDLEPGTFGENLTISDLESARFSIGERFRIGSVVLEVTAPRIPCSTLAARMQDPQFVKKYRRAERPGLYCRVIEEGTLQTGDEVTLEGFPGEAVAVIEIFRHHYRRCKEEALLRRFLRAPLAERARRDIEADLRRLLATS